MDLKRRSWQKKYILESIVEWQFLDEQLSYILKVISGPPSLED